jgi:hypothetical protein
MVQMKDFFKNLDLSKWQDSEPEGGTQRHENDSAFGLFEWV